MKKHFLAKSAVFVALTATAVWLSCGRSSPPTTRQPPLQTKQAGASNVTKQTGSSVPPQATAQAIPDIPATIPDADIPDEDRKDDEAWRKTAEAKAIWYEIYRIIDVAGVVGSPNNLTTNQAAVLIGYMHSPHYFARWKAVLAAGTATSEPARSMVLPHVISLLSDPVYAVRDWAADTLGIIGDKSMIPYLEPLLNDHPNVARSARRAISKLEQKETVPKDH